MKKILITAASGQTGTRLIKQLVSKGHMVRAMVTRPTSADVVAALGAEPTIGNAWNPQDLLRAMDGMDSVYHIAPTFTYDEPALGKLLIDAALKSKLQHFVLHGVMAPYLDNINYHWAKMLIQRDLYRSGLNYTVLLPTNFMQNVSWTWPLIAKQNKGPLPYSIDQKLTWVDLEDVVSAAAAVLTEPGHEFGTYELSGKDAYLSRREITELMSQALGRKIEAVQETPDDYLKHARTQPFFERFSDKEVNQILAMFDDYDRYGMPAGNPKVLEMLLGRPAASYKDFVARLVSASGVQGQANINSYGLPI